MARVQVAIRFEHENIHVIKGYDFKRGDLILVRNTAIEKALNRKMRARYLGPFIVISHNRGGAYIVCELDGSILDRQVKVFRVLPYFARASLPLQRLEEVLDVAQERLREMEESEEEDPDAGEGVEIEDEEVEDEEN